MNKNTNRLNIFGRVRGYLKDYGFITTAYLVKQRLEAKAVKNPYEVYIESREANIRETEELPYKPLFSFVVPVYNVKAQQLRECIESILNQTYNNFELILADDKSTWDEVYAVLKEYEGRERVRVIYRSENGHISRCTNTGIEAAEGEYIVFADCDDVVAPNAVYELTRAVNKDRTIDFIYSDEDKLSEDGKKRSFPFFKPDWSPDTFMSLMYTSHLSCCRRSLVNEIGGLRTGFEGSQDYDFIMRLTEKTKNIYHIPAVLYHWRQRAESTAADAGAKPYVREAVLKLKREALERRGLKGRLVYEEELSQLRVVYDTVGSPLVSIIIPSKDNYEIIKRCITSLFELTEYKNYEIVIVDNGSSEENKRLYGELAQGFGAVYHHEKMPFNFSKMCNIGARLAKGEYLLFLNDDMEIIQKDWLGNMLGHAMLEHVGAVGAKLYYPESTFIQHCGVINLPVGPCHAFSRMDDSRVFNFCRNRLEYNYLAVTAACLCVSREKFNAVGGFDEGLAVAYNDVDFCFKLYEKGWYNTVRCDVVLYHYESFSRGIDTEDEEKLKRLYAEQKKLYEKHPHFKNNDPFYNVNLGMNRTDFELPVSCFTSFSEPCGQIESMEKYIAPEAVRAFFDKISKDEYIEVIGWAFINRTLFNALNRKSVILADGEGNCLLFKARTMLRLDVGASFGKKSLNLSGFSCSIRCGGLKKGTYKVGIFLENPLTGKRLALMSDKTVHI